MLNHVMVGTNDIERAKRFYDAVLGTLERLEKGGVSEMALTADKGVIVYVIEKKAPDTTETTVRITG